MPRPATAVDESLESFTTPVPATLNGRPELLVAGGDCLTNTGAALALEDAVRVQQPRAKHQLAWRDT